MGALAVGRGRYFRPYGQEIHMKKRNLKKIHLAKETLRSMLDSELTWIVGEKRSAGGTCGGGCSVECTREYLNDLEGADTFGG